MVYSAVWIKSFSSSHDARVPFRHFVQIPYIFLIAPDRGTFQIVEGLKHLFKVYLSVGIHAYRPQKMLTNRMHGISSKRSSLIIMASWTISKPQKLLILNFF